MCTLEMLKRPYAEKAVSLYNLVGNLPERKSLANQFCIFWRIIACWDRPLSVSEKHSVVLVALVLQPHVNTMRGCGGVAFSILGLSLYKPDRNPTGKKNPCSVGILPKRFSTVFFQLGCPCTNLVGNLPERKPLQTDLLVLFWHIACRDRPLSEKEREMLEYRNTSL